MGLMATVASRHPEGLPINRMIIKVNYEDEDILQKTRIDNFVKQKHGPVDS